MRKHRFITAAVLLSLTPLLSGTARANMSTTDDGNNPPPPPSLSKLENIQPETTSSTGGLPIDIRAEAQKQAALSYGARGGLAWRTYHIRAELEERAQYMDKVFDFRHLLIPAPSGLWIEPPIVSEQVNAMIIGTNGRDAAVADRVYNMCDCEGIVSTARNWRNYLERDWGEVADPPDSLRPQNADERKKWVQWVADGWDKGVAQADAIFQDDITELTSDYQGMVRYRLLLAQGMITPPTTEQVDRGVTGGGKKMRVGDRAVIVTGMPELVSGSEAWQPASR